MRPHERRPRPPEHDVETASDAAAPEPNLDGKLWGAFAGKGGKLALILLVAGMLDEFDGIIITVFAPEIQRSLDVSDTQLLALSGLGGIALVMGTIPFARLADRFRRTRILAGTAALWSLACAFTGVAVNGGQLGISRALSNFASSAKVPVTPTLLADRYPPSITGRIFALEGLGRPAGQVIAPLAVVWLGGTFIVSEDDWRSAMFAVGLLAIPLVALFWWQGEPIRGRFGLEGIASGSPETQNEPARFAAVAKHLRSVRSFHALVMGMAVLGFALVAVPKELSLMLDSEYGLNPYERATAISLSWVLALASVPFGGWLGDRLRHRQPSSLLKFMAIAIASYGISLFVGLVTHSLGALISTYAVANACQAAAFVQLGPFITSVVPSELQSRAFSVVGLYVFFVGGIVGGILTGSISDTLGERPALQMVVLPAALVGGLLIWRGATAVDDDIANIERKAAHASVLARAEAVVRPRPHLDVFDLTVVMADAEILNSIAFQIRRGECVAIVGRNASGKTTLLKTLAGLIEPTRGMITFDDRPITLADADERVRRGIGSDLLDGSLFADLSVIDHIALRCGRHADGTAGRRAAELVQRHASLHDVLHRPVGLLSGGQRRQLSFFLATLGAPSLLLIDEISFGLDVEAMERMITDITELVASGVTVIFCAQEPDLARTLATRAIALDGGRIVFDGPTADLATWEATTEAIFFRDLPAPR